MTGANTFTEDEHRNLKNLYDVLREFLKLRPNMPMHQVVVMLKVALDEGKSLKQYAKETEFAPSTISRTFLDCGPKMRSGKGGLGLLEARSSAHSLREYETYFSVKGRLLMKATSKKLGRR